MVRTRRNAAVMRVANNTSITPTPTTTATPIFSPAGSAEVGTPGTSDIEETKSIPEEMRTEYRVTRSKKRVLELVQDVVLEERSSKRQTTTNRTHIAIEVKAKDVKVRNCIKYKQLN